MLIANTTDQKFLEAILAELRKTNELLESLCSIAKGAGATPEESKGVTNDGQPHSSSSRRANNSKSSGDGPKRGSERQTVSDSEHRSATTLFPPNDNGNGGKRNAGSGRKRVSGKTNGKK